MHWESGLTPSLHLGRKRIPGSHVHKPCCPVVGAQQPLTHHYIVLLLFCHLAIVSCHMPHHDLCPHFKSWYELMWNFIFPMSFRDNILFNFIQGLCWVTEVSREDFTVLNNAQSNAPPFSVGQKATLSFISFSHANIWFQENCHVGHSYWREMISYSLFVPASHGVSPLISLH